MDDLKSNCQVMNYRLLRMRTTVLEEEEEGERCRRSSVMDAVKFEAGIVS